MRNDLSVAVNETDRQTDATADVEAKQLDANQSAAAVDQTDRPEAISDDGSDDDSDEESSGDDDEFPQPAGERVATKERETHHAAIPNFDHLDKKERKKAVKEFNRERRANKTPKAEKKRKEKLAKVRRGLKA